MKKLLKALAVAGLLLGAEHGTAAEWRPWPGDPLLEMQFQVLMPDDPLVVAWRLPEWSTKGPIWQSLDVVQIDCEGWQWRYVRGQVFRDGAVGRSLTDRQKWEPFPTHYNSGSGKLMRGLCDGSIPIAPDAPGS